VEGERWTQFEEKIKMMYGIKCAIKASRVSLAENVRDGVALHLDFCLPLSTSLFTTSVLRASQLFSLCSINMFYSLYRAKKERISACMHVCMCVCVCVIRTSYSYNSEYIYIYIYHPSILIHLIGGRVAGAADPPG